MINIELKQMADRIKARRSAMNYTQENFAEMINLSISSYTKIENAFQQPSLDTLIKISKQLNTSMDYILFGENSDNNNIDKIELIDAVLRYCEKDKLLHASTVLKMLAQIED